MHIIYIRRNIKGENLEIFEIGYGTVKNLYPIDSIDEILEYLNDGTNEEEKGFTTAYFTSHEEVKASLNSFGLME